MGARRGRATPRARARGDARRGRGRGPLSTLRLLSYNVRYGGTGRERELASVIRATGADVVMLQEATDPGVVERLAADTGLAHWQASAGDSTGFMSRIRPVHHEWHRPRAARHPFLELVLDGVEVRLFGLHLSAWFASWKERRRTREIRALLAGIDREQHGPHLIVGDFNALAPGARLEVGRMPRWIRAMIWVSGRDIERATIQTLLDAGYADAFRARHPESDGATFPTWDPHLRLDYAFLPAPDLRRVLRCEVVSDLPDAAAASDHFPLLLELDER